MQRRSLPPDVYQRLIENKWIEGSGSFITRQQLEACIDASWGPQLSGQGARYIAAIDLGLKRDRTALAIGHLDTKTQRVWLDSLQTWQGSRAHPVSIAEVEGELEGIRNRFSIHRLICDPWQMQSTIQRLRGRLPVQEFTFSAENVRRLSETLFNLIQSGRLRLYPDEELERELLSLNVVQKSYGWRMDHTSGGYSDRAIALGMMAMEALNTPVGGRIGLWV
jgi:hypothetical protein